MAAYKLMTESRRRAADLLATIREQRRISSRLAADCRAFNSAWGEFEQRWGELRPKKRHSTKELRKKAWESFINKSPPAI